MNCFTEEQIDYLNLHYKNKEKCSEEMKEQQKYSIAMRSDISVIKTLMKATVSIATAVAIPALAAILKFLFLR